MESSCFFGAHLSSSVTAVTDFFNCDEGEQKLFGTLDPELQEKIMYRSCVKEVDEDVRICSTHEKFLANDYQRRIKGGNTYCMWPSHSTKRKCTGLRNPFNSNLKYQKKQSLYLYSTHSIILPFQSQICRNCRPDCMDKLKDFDEEQIRSPIIRRRTLALENDIEMTDMSQSTNASQASAYNLPSQEVQKNKKARLDSLLDENNIEVRENWLYHEDWNDIEPKRKRQVLNYVGAGVASVIHSVVPDKNQDGLVYKDLKESKYVEKHLYSDVPPPEFVQEIILSLNYAGSDAARQQYLSTLYGMPGITFKFLEQFNRIFDEMHSDSDSDDDSSSFDRNSIHNKLRFNFRFTYHLWISAIKHRLRFGYGNAPVIKEKSFKWFYDLEVLNAIFDYVVSPLNTQRNSYGVFNIKEENGQKSTIGRVIRHQRNSDLVKNIMSHLKSLGLPVPSASFIFKFLTYLPAASQKEMKGVNNIQEDAMRSFKVLDEIVDRYSNQCGLTEDERINLKTCLASNKTYLKTQYYDNLSFHSPVISHCVSCSVSDPKDKKEFIELCENKHESIKCDNCEMIYDTNDVLMKLMEKYREEGKLNNYEAAVIFKRLTDAQNAVLQYQIHLIKVFCQENEWQKLMDKRDPQVAFFEGDWGMKILPRRFRGKQSEWFAQNGISNHIGCFTRIVPFSFEDDGVTTKVFRKEVDTYVSVVEDDSKQDALTSAAIIKENLQAYKNNHPDVKKIYLRSDNAGCYKSSKLIQALFSIADSIPDLQIMGYVYSAPCDGKSLCDTYAAIVKHHLSKMVCNGFDITNPRLLAEAIAAASGIANVVVMIGTFSFNENCDFMKIPKITDLNTISFLEHNIVAWKQGRFGTGLMIPMTKIPFPSAFQFEFVGSMIPRRNEKQKLIYRKSGEEETVEGTVEDCDDNLDELEGPVMEGSIYKCPNDNCDAEYITLGNFFKHQIVGNCFKKTKKRTQSIKSYYQRKYIEKYNMNQSENLSTTEKRYKHVLWDEEQEHITLLISFSKSNDSTANIFVKGFAVKTLRTKNVIHNEVRAFVREKFEEGEITNRHMPYPKIVSEIESATDSEGNPRFYPNKWLDVGQVSYLISSFMKEKNPKVTATTDDEDISEGISVARAEENFSRKNDAIQEAIEGMQSATALSDQSHPLLMSDGTNICDIAKNYYDNEKTKDSLIMQQDFQETLLILNAIGVQVEGKSKRKAGKEILNYVKTKCNCIPLRRKRNT